MSNDELSIIQSDDGLVADVRCMIKQTRAVNAGMTLLYRRVGMRIRTEVLENEWAEYGQETLATLSRELASDFGRGSSRRNFFRMMHCYAKCTKFPSRELCACFPPTSI